MEIAAVTQFDGVVRFRRQTGRQEAGDLPSGTRSSLCDVLHDRYEPDVCATAPATERTNLLAEIKNRIKSGYYSSREVVDDLSDTFARAFQNI